MYVLVFTVFTLARLCSNYDNVVLCYRLQKLNTLETNRTNCRLTNKNEALTGMTPKQCCVMLCEGMCSPMCTDVSETQGRPVMMGTAGSSETSK